MQLPDRSYELKHTSYGKMINVRASEIQPNISLPNTVDSAATIGETKRVTADQKDLANRDRVSYITLLGHRIQDDIDHRGASQNYRYAIESFTMKRINPANGF